MTVCGRGTVSGHCFSPPPHSVVAQPFCSLATDNGVFNAVSLDVFPVNDGRLGGGDYALSYDLSHKSRTDNSFHSLKYV